MQTKKIFDLLILSTVLVLPIKGFSTQQDEIHKFYDAIVDKAPETRALLNVAERNELFRRASQHSVAGTSHIDDYDWQPTGIGNNEIGFCYGRAMAVHLIARKMGLNKASIQKIFIAGDLRDGETRWRFHMATMVQGEDEEWYVIDPIMPDIGREGVLTPYEWMVATKMEFDLRTDGKDDSHFFVTNPDSIMVDMRVVPALTVFENQERLIEPSFDPTKHEGFKNVSWSRKKVPAEDLKALDKNPSYYQIYSVTGADQAKYFTLRKGKPIIRNGKELRINDFDFFHLALVILYDASRLVSPEDPNQPHPSPAPGNEKKQPDYITRAYQYNGFFVNLVNSVQGNLEPLQPPHNPSPNDSGLESNSGGSEHPLGAKRVHRRLGLRLPSFIADSLKK